MTTDGKTKPTGPIEVWLTLNQSGFGVQCTIVADNETTRRLDVHALSMRGAEREMTGYFIANGYTPAGRWSAETGTQDGDVLEASRIFQPAK